MGAHLRSDDTEDAECAEEGEEPHDTTPSLRPTCELDLARTYQAIIGTQCAHGPFDRQAHRRLEQEPETDPRIAEPEKPTNHKQDL